MIGRNYYHDQDPEIMKAFEDTAFNQDKEIVELQRPEFVPFDLADELHMRFDAVAVNYRKAMREHGCKAHCRAGAQIRLTPPRHATRGRRRPARVPHEPGADAVTGSPNNDEAARRIAEARPAWTGTAHLGALVGGRRLLLHAGPPIAVPTRYQRRYATRSPSPVSTRAGPTAGTRQTR